MSTSEAAKLVGLIDSEIEELTKVCEGVDEETAGSAPEGRWSPKQILSHLCGPEGKGVLSVIMPFVEENVPLIELEAEDPFFSENRAKMTFSELLSEVQQQYWRVAGFASALDAARLSRTAHIPALKSSPIGAYPTLGAWIEMITIGHISFHIGHMKEILRQLGK